MKANINFLLTAFVLIIFSSSCEENESNIPSVATIRIVNAVQDIGTVDLRGFEGNISFFGANAVRYGSDFRFTIPTSTPTILMIAPESDTLNVLYNETINLEETGGIYSLFLYGDSTQVQALTIQDEFINYTDSVFGTRFINLSEDSEPVTIRNVALDTAGVRDTTELASNIAFQDVTSFSEFEVTNRIENHTFQYLDQSGDILASVTIPQFSFFSPPYFKNITLGLIGRSDDGEGGNNLSIMTIEHFE